MHTNMPKDRQHQVITTCLYDAPCGQLLLGVCDNRLCLCDWQQGKTSDILMQRLQKRLGAIFASGECALFDTVKSQLDEYFTGRRHEFSIPLLFAGTDFQLAVWNALLSIPYGTTISYAELAEITRCSKAVRAVANASGANALSVIVPCHRVIGSNNTLTGYGGGIGAKEFLLRLEGAMPEAR